MQSSPGYLETLGIPMLAGRGFIPQDHENPNNAAILSREAAASIPSLDELAAKARPNRPAVDLRWIMIHMIEEYARHCGHADFLREAIDGSTGD